VGATGSAVTPWPVGKPGPTVPSGARKPCSVKTSGARASAARNMSAAVCTLWGRRSTTAYGKSSTGASTTGTAVSWTSVLPALYATTACSLMGAAATPRWNSGSSAAVSDGASPCARKIPTRAGRSWSLATTADCTQKAPTSPAVSRRGSDSSSGSGGGWSGFTSGASSGARNTAGSIGSSPTTARPASVTASTIGLVASGIRSGSKNERLTERTLVTQYEESGTQTWGRASGPGLVAGWRAATSSTPPAAAASCAATSAVGAS